MCVCVVLICVCVCVVGRGWTAGGGGVCKGACGDVGRGAQRQAARRAGATHMGVCASALAPPPRPRPRASLPHASQAHHAHVVSHTHLTRTHITHRTSHATDGGAANPRRVRTQPGLGRARGVRGGGVRGAGRVRGGARQQGCSSSSAAARKGGAARWLGAHVRRHTSHQVAARVTRVSLPLSSTHHTHHSGALPGAGALHHAPGAVQPAARGVEE